jgi:hypothetical protein
MSAESIGTYILKSKKNLHIAAAVGEAWPLVRQKLISDFLNHVGQRLKKKLHGWEFEPWGEYFRDAYGGYYIWKPAWQEEYYINLECSQYGNKMIFGVWRDQTKLAKQPFCNDVLTAVREKYPSARSRDWWEAQITMQTPARDWRPPEVLWRLHQDKKFQDEVVAQLLDVALTAAPIIDKLMKRK